MVGEPGRTLPEASVQREAPDFLLLFYPERKVKVSSELRQTVGSSWVQRGVPATGRISERKAQS